MKKKLFFSIPVVLLVFLLYSTFTTAQMESSCITCHTSETLLKLLCKVPELPKAEGEG